MDSPPSSSRPPLSPVDQFRGAVRRRRMHPLERAAFLVIALHLVFLPWALGAMRVWAQWISFALALLSLGVALIPRDYDDEQSTTGGFRLIMWPKLLRFPVFWLGLALLALVLVQALNPAWAYRSDGRGWWMEARPSIAWLPAGVDVPFDRWGPWRMLLIFASCWLTVCAAWIAFTRRRSIQLLLIVLAVNGVALSVFGVAQRLLGNGRIYWAVESTNSSFFSTFIYKNHAGAYLNLALALTCGLAAWYYYRGVRRLEKSNPSGVLVFCATIIAVSILTSYARGATLAMIAFLCLCLGTFIVHQFVVTNEQRKPVIAFAMLLVFGFFLKTGLDALRAGEAWDRIRAGITRQDLSLEYRERATRAAREMLAENWVRGVGAGGFRFTFPVYQHRHPDLVEAEGRRMYWEQAHNDVLQYPIELGVAGLALLAAALGWFGLQLIRGYGWENPLSACAVLGLLLLLAYSWFDFPLQCPAILVTWCALWPLVTRWTQLEESRG